MSKKFKVDWREVKDNIGIFFLIMCVGLLIVVLAVGVVALFYAVQAFITSTCWNVAFTKMFGFKEMTILQAFVLFLAISGLRTSYLANLKRYYDELNKIYLEMLDKEKMAKVVSVCLIVIMSGISIAVTVYCVMYSWNIIIPQLIGVDLVQIDIVQTLGFCFIINQIFKSSSSSYKDSNEKENESKNSENKEDSIINIFLSNIEEDDDERFDVFYDGGEDDDIDDSEEEDECGDSKENVEDSDEEDNEE